MQLTTTAREQRQRRWGAASDKPLTAFSRAISVLEILERILSFLPQQCIRQVASLVCKDWYALCRPLLVHQFTWTDAPAVAVVTLPAPPESLTDQNHNPSRARRWYRRRRLSSSTVERIVSITPDPAWLTNRLENLTTLRCRLSYRSFVLTASMPPEETTATVTQVTTTTMEALQRTARSDLLDAVQRLTTARKLSLLELEIETLDDFECFLQPMLQHTSMLTRLWLKNLRIQWLPIGLVLGQCPRLEELHVGCEAHSMGSRLVMTLFAETYVDSSQGGTGAHTDGDLDSGTALSSNKGLETLKLKRLRLKDVLFKESDLRTILDAAPDLYELMIQTMPPPSTPTIPIHMAITDQAPLPADVHTPVSTETRAMGDWISCDRMDFIQDIGLQYPQLTSLHFTRAYHRYTDSQIRTILSSFPRASRWCVVWRDLPDGILRDLNNCVQSASRRAPRDIYLDSGTPHIYTNHLTSLEITPSSDWTPRWGNALHEFLCDSPSLEHLRAGSIAYYIENLDLNGVLPDQEEYHQLLQDDSDGVDDSNPSSSTKPSPQIPSSRRVWACQNLKTLHLEFTRRRHLQHNNAFRSSYADPSASASSSSTHSSTSGNLSSITVLENSPKLSRIVFGYISRFCPRLQDLLIRGYRLNMTLQGGFCLLTRLRELKKVAISQYDCQFRMRDILPWVTKRRSSVTRSQRLRWRAMFAGWWPLIHRKELKCNVPSSVDTGAEQGVEDGAWIGLGVERLGQLSDVVDVLRNLTTISPSLSSSSPQSRSSGQQDLWTDQSDYVWPSLECVRIVYGNRISLERRGDFIRDLLKTHRPEVEFQWVSWLHQYC